MTASGARRLAHGIWIATAVLWLVALILTVVDSPEEAVGVGSWWSHWRSTRPWVRSSRAAIPRTPSDGSSLRSA
jgi:hypothetical protein